MVCRDCQALRLKPKPPVAILLDRQKCSGVLRAETCCHNLKFLTFTYTYSSICVVTTAYWARRYRSDGSLAYNQHVIGNWAYDNTIDVWRETALALDASATYPWDM